MAKHIGFDFQSVSHLEFGTGSLEQALIAHLTTRLGIERGSVQHHHALLPSIQDQSRRAIDIQGQNFGAGLKLVVAHKSISNTCIFQGAVHSEFTCCTGLRFLALHGQGKASFVHIQIALSANIGR